MRVSGFVNISISAVLPMLLAGCVADSADLRTALAAIDEEGFADAVRTLSSDEFDGRLPSTHGEELTINYLTERFSALGLEPGNGDSFFQEVPLVEITAAPNAHLTVGVLRIRPI